MIISVWTKNGTDEVRTHQLSNDPEDGSVADQIAHLSGLDVFDGYTCVSSNYTGSFPEAAPSLWRWDSNGSIFSVEPAPVPEPSSQQVRVALEELGMTPDQLNKLFAAAAAL